MIANRVLPFFTFPEFVKTPRVARFVSFKDLKVSILRPFGLVDYDTTVRALQERCLMGDS